MLMNQWVNECEGMKVNEWIGEYEWVWIDK